MAYSTQPGKGTLYCTGNADDKRLPRYAQVLGFDTTPLVFADNSHFNDIGAFLQYDGLLPPSGTINYRDASCSMYLKGFLLSAPCVSQYHTTYPIAYMFAHDTSNQNGQSELANIVGNGLFVTPKNATYDVYDALLMREGPTTDYYYYFKDVECNVYQLISVEGYHVEDPNIAVRVFTGGSSFTDGYKKLNGAWHATIYQNVKVKILMLEMHYTHSETARTRFYSPSVTHALLEITVDGNKHTVEITGADNNIKQINEHFVHEVTSQHGNPSNHGNCTHVAYNGSSTNERVVPNTNIDGQYYDAKAAKAIHATDLKTGNVVLTTFDFADIIITTESNDNNNDVIRTHLASEFIYPDNLVEVGATNLANMTISISESTPYEAESYEQLDTLRDIIFSQAVINYDYYYNGKVIANHSYKLFTGRNGAETHGFEIGKFTKNGQPIGITDLTEQQIIKMEDLADIPYASMTSDGLFITPMEYYAGKTTNRIEGSKLVLENKIDDSINNIPTYFWVETLKNWCTYEYEKLTEWNGFARLKVWNGKNNWYYLDEILQQQRACQLTIEQMKTVRARYLNAPTIADQKLLTKFRNILIANSSLYRFPYEKLNTTILQRVYTPHNKPNWIVEDDTFFLVRVVSKAVDFIRDYGMMIVDWSPISLVYNGYNDGIGAAFGAGWNRWKSALDDIFGGFEALVSPVINWLFSDKETTDTLENRLKKIDTRKVLVNAVEYLFLPYDTGYTSNDSTTFQTIRFRNEWGTDGIVSRTSLKAGHNIGNPMGSPLVVRSTTGELTLAVSMTYQGPWKQFYGDEDYEKHVGINQTDVDMTNDMLASMLGDGKDKTAADYLNIRGGLLQNVAVSTTSSLQTVMANGIVPQNNASDKSSGSITLTTNRSKTSSDVESIEINTLTKW